MADERDRTNGGPSLLGRAIRFCLEKKLVVLLLVLFVVVAGVMFAPFDWDTGPLQRHPVPVDAIPDIGENQQIVFTRWMGRSPQDVEDQIGYPLTVALLGVPSVKTIRSFSMFGFSSIYVIFEENVEFFELTYLDAADVELDIAFSERYGFLTACPTNVGTGLRVSVLIHLPGLVHSREINKLLESLGKLNHTMRGFYGEGSEVMGNFFQLSNSITLGASEEALIKNLREMAKKVVGFERKAREMLFSKARSLLEDKVWRAYGLLRYAHSVSTKEALSLISAVRLGVGVGIVEDVSIKALNHLLIYTQPAHLQRMKGNTMDAKERDVARAEYIRSALVRNTL